MTDCYNTNHFTVDADGALTPQPWMQWRHVAGVANTSVARSYPVTLSSGSIDIFGTLAGLFGTIFNSLLGIFGHASILAPLTGAASAAGNKNDLLHDMQTAWTNDSPIDQWVYGKITRGGARVSLQARSRGGLLLSSGYKAAVGDAGPLSEAGMFGCGADLGNAGTLSIGTKFCVHEVRQHAHTIPLAPERLGWYRLAPGATFTARCQLRFISEYWESTAIDGGTSGSESTVESGDTRLDLFAVPVIG